MRKLAVKSGTWSDKYKDINQQIWYSPIVFEEDFFATVPLRDFLPIERMITIPKEKCLDMASQIWYQYSYEKRAY